MFDITVPAYRIVGTAPRRSDVVAVITGYNERRHVVPLLSFYMEHGIDVAYLDDGSTDGTLDIVNDHIGAPVVFAAVRPHSEVFSWAGLMEDKEVLIRQLPYPWVMHADMDEYRSGPDGSNLAAAIAEADRCGANAVNFQEYTFLPTAEEPDHDHERYRETMRWYYPFSPRPKHRLNAFKPAECPDFDLVTEAGHRLLTDHARILCEDFVMDHYVFLSLDHFREQYIGRTFAAEDTDRGWHHNRLDLAVPTLPHAADLSDLHAVGHSTRNARPTHLWTTSTQ
jgi:hypothetical protein